MLFEKQYLLKWEDELRRGEYRSRNKENSDLAVMLLGICLNELKT